MGRLKIALLVAQGDEEYQSDFVRGAMKKAFSEGGGCLCILDVHQISEYSGRYSSTLFRESS
ncbi:MAG: hypothetical protein K6E28_06375 [Eubacterium sp.]|nr:hypothetical protein [Eubacterium sp.]